MRMKKKHFSLLVLVAYFWCSTVFAEGSDTPEPNEYKEKEIEIKKSYQNDVSKRGELPEEQKHLTFQKQDQTDSMQLREQLFQISRLEANTIIAKADQLALFSKQDRNTIRKQEIQPTESPSNILTVLIVTVVIIIAAMFLLIIPKYKQSHN